MGGVHTDSGTPLAQNSSQEENSSFLLHQPTIERTEVVDEPLAEVMSYNSRPLINRNNQNAQVNGTLIAIQDH